MTPKHNLWHKNSCWTTILTIRLGLDWLWEILLSSSKWREKCNNKWKEWTFDVFSNILFIQSCCYFEVIFRFSFNLLCHEKVMDLLQFLLFSFFSNPIKIPYSVGIYRVWEILLKFEFVHFYFLHDNAAKHVYSTWNIKLFHCKIVQLA